MKLQNAPTANTMLARWKKTDIQYADFNKTHAKPIYSRERSLEMLRSHLDLNGTTGFDFGCGEGLFADMLRTHGARVLGCDISVDLLNPNDSDVWLGGVDSLARIETGSMDFFIDRNCLHTILVSDAERKRGLSEASRITKPGGFLLIVTGNSSATPATNRPMNPLTFKDELKSYGFEEIAQDFYNIYWPRPLRYVLPKMGAAMLKSLPMRIKRKRGSAYISLSRRL